MKLAELEAGQQLGRFALDIRPEFVARYVDATADASAPSPHSEGRPVPPMAIIATGLGKVIDALKLTGGTIHAGQEVEFLRPVVCGERVYAEAELTAVSVRRGSRFASIVTRFFDSANKSVASALSTIVVPVEETT